MIWFLPQPRASEGKRSEPLKAHQCLNQSITSTEKKNYIYFISIFYPSTSQSQRGGSCGSRFSTECVTSSCNVSTSKRSRWVEEMQCETPWAEWELMKAWCKFCVASQPVFYTTTVQQSWKAPQEGNMKPTKPNPPFFKDFCLPIILIYSCSCLSASCFTPFLPIFLSGWLGVRIWSMSSHTRSNQAS